MEKTISADSARRLYDLLARQYDRFSFFEARAKRRAIALLDLSPGQWVLNVGTGTGREQLLIQRVVAPDGRSIGVDISPGMLKMARSRVDGLICLADGAALPFRSRQFDRLYCAYVLDLIPSWLIPTWLLTFRRILRSGGRLVVLSLTEGVDLPSRAFVGLWRLAYRVSPFACGGCRPLQLAEAIRQAGFVHIYREVIVQFGVPSEVISAEV